jgi:hypothetical protein
VTVAQYKNTIQDGFRKYRHLRYAQQAHLFETRPDDGPVVFQRKHADANILVPANDIANEDERKRIVEMIPPRERHRHFGSMSSSQALAQSVFGVIGVLKRQSQLSSVLSDDGKLAFGPSFETSSLKLEKSLGTLGEPRPTSVDVGIEGPYRVAVECKLTERGFGQCSRPHLTKKKPNFETDYCDGSFSVQRERTERCTLTQIKIRYWDYLDTLMGWRSDIDHRPCPLSFTYQLVRNILAACVEDGAVNTISWARAGHLRRA